MPRRAPAVIVVPPGGGPGKASTGEGASIFGEIWIVLALILANGLLAGAEIAVVALRPARVRELAAAGGSAAHALQLLRHRPERFLATVQVGITVIGATAAAYGGAALAEDLSPLIAGLPFVGPYADPIAFVLLVSGISFVSVVLGELVPKSLALRSSERYALLAARPLVLLSRVAGPAVWLLTGAANLVLKPLKDSTTFTETRVSVDELRSLVDEASRAGTVDRDVGAIASRALELAELTAEEVMVHRRFVVAVPRDAGEERLKHALLEAGHRRVPVFDQRPDELVGYVSWRDALARLWAGQPLDVAEMLHPPYLVPESMPAIDLLKDMQSGRVHMAFVVDEHGGLSGLVTLEDLLEELVGEIVSEHGKSPPSPVRREAGGIVLVSGTTPLRDVDRELGTGLDGLDEEATTMGGLCITLAGGRIPSPGERIALPRWGEAEVVEASARRVKLVRLRLAAPASGGGSAAPG